MPTFCSRMFLFLLFMATTFHFQFQMCHANCRFNKTSPWAQCQCEGGGVANGGEGIRLNCWKMDWEKLPELRGIWEAGTKEEEQNGNDKIEQPNSRNSIGALSIKFTRIGQLGQDAFRAEPTIQLLELCRNAIQTINANAFRGLEAQLVQLHLSGNRLEQIPSWAFTYLRQLQILKLEGNQIEQIGADTFAEAHLPNLRYFHLDGNRIFTIQNGSLSRLPVLQVLTLATNQIEQIEPNSLPNSLWFLDLKDNRLSNIPFAALNSLTALKMLDLERNNITELRGAAQFTLDTDLDLKLAHNRIRLLGEGAFDGFRRFGQLDLSHNQIGSISEKAFRSIHSIQSLDLSSNSLLQIPQNAFLRFAHSLRRLRLDQNQLAQWPAAISPLMGLRQLSLDGNQLGGLASHEFMWKGLKANLSELSLARNGIERIPSEAIHGMTSLRSLDLSRNSITKIGKMAFGSPEGLTVNGGISPLQKLNLAGNRIRELADPGAFLYLGQLVHLDCSHNRINRLTKATLERLESLETLSLDHNEMLEFPRNALSSLTRLRQLTMEANRLVMLPNYAFQWLVHMQRLNLARNRLHTLNAKNFHSTSAIQIKWLSLAHNRISRMETAAFLNLPNLEQLFLHHNRLTVLQTQIISSLKNLRQLTLAHNLINETQESAFANLPQLEFLSLAHNRLRTIKEGVFHKVPSLSRLDFSHNRIEAFDLDFLGANIHQLQVLDLSHNVIRKLEIQPAKGTLRYLNLRNNQLEFIHGQMLQGFEQLRSVDLSHNDLIELNAGAFWRSHRLERIVLAENNLRQIWRESFRDQQLIHLLDLSGNVLQSLDAGLFGANNLLELDLGRNNLSAIPTRALQSIRGSLSRLGLAQNGITKLDPRDFEGLRNLSEFELAGNRIGALEEEVFSLLPRLQKLDLSGNPVASWSPHTFMGLSPSLAHLDLSGAGLFSMPRLRAPYLRSLNLSSNFLYELADTDFDKLPALISLDLSRNRLTELRIQLLERMPQLRMLNLSENGLRSMEESHFRAMPQLEVLIMSKMNSLTNLPSPSAWAFLPKLHSLELHSLPALDQLDFGQILHFTPPLRQIHFESRAEHFTGTELAKADLRLLRRLTISGKSIRQIEPNAFGRLRGFRLDLTVENIQIRHFPLQAMVAHLQGISFLRLSLANNRIQSIASPFGGQGQRPPVLNQRGTVLERLDLRENPLICDCQMHWIAQWVANIDLAEAEKLIVGQCSRTMNEEEEGQWAANSGQKTVPTLLEWAKRVVNEGGGEDEKLLNGNGQQQCFGHFGPIRDSAKAKRSTKWICWMIWGLWWWIGRKRMANF